MQKLSFVGSLILTAALSAGCATAGSGKADQAGYNMAVAAAKAAQTKAKSVGGEWRDIGKFLKKADAAAKGGDFAGAIKLAKKAEWQGNAGHDQAMAEKNAGHPSYLK
ncbi:MAG TPA: SoxXA-binding protein [Chromatiaceae bacterium]|jgi:hypothetical protein|nr:SoxXA-binding protein [Chromatiaceae bacterium]HIN82748.1 SoxXA-binding protein [Chromatiales bacterium]HIA08387.1 SoxXA-binding protein [Chromatiaceae bacterium]HIB84886.1 SoxXA-binding protein [Chromatiaceae bacterium]HIO14623.1 SoxXA-binding protein [Chromatiales bacterium]